MVAGRAAGRDRAGLQRGGAPPHRRTTAVSAGRSGARVPDRHPALPAGRSLPHSDFPDAHGYCGCGLGDSCVRRRCSNACRSSRIERAACVEPRQDHRRHLRVRSGRRRCRDCAGLVDPAVDRTAAFDAVRRRRTGRCRNCCGVRGKHPGADGRQHFHAVRGGISALAGKFVQRRSAAARTAGSDRGGTVGDCRQRHRFMAGISRPDRHPLRNARRGAGRPRHLCGRRRSRLAVSLPDILRCNRDVETGASPQDAPRHR